MLTMYFDIREMQLRPGWEERRCLGKADVTVVFPGRRSPQL